jgi:hypothetical protein
LEQKRIALYMAEKSVVPKPAFNISFSLPGTLRIGPSSKRVLELKFNHPEWTAGQIGKEIGISQQRVSTILRNPRILAAMPVIAKARFAGLVPKAVKAYEELVSQDKNLQVKEKAAAQVLKDSNVIDAPTLTIKHELSSKPIAELQAILDNAKGLPSGIVDAELVDEQDTEGQ